jgi:hypothetical protein
MLIRKVRRMASFLSLVLAVSFAPIQIQAASAGGSNTVTSTEYSSLASATTTLYTSTTYITKANITTLASIATLNSATLANLNLAKAIPGINSNIAAKAATTKLLKAEAEDKLASTAVTAYVKVARAAKAANAQAIALGTAVYARAYSLIAADSTSKSAAAISTYNRANSLYIVAYKASAKLLVSYNSAVDAYNSALAAMQVALAKARALSK